MVLFSGDALSPSAMSTITRGEQMAPVLRECGVACAVLGNHDLDWGLELAKDLVGSTGCPWVLANVFDSAHGELLGGSAASVILDHAGVRVGLFGLIEREWMDTLSEVDVSTLVFTDPIEASGAVWGSVCLCVCLCVCVYVCVCVSVCLCVSACV